MKSLTKELWMHVPGRRAIVSIHDDVERLVTREIERSVLVDVEDHVAGHDVAADVAEVDVGDRCCRRVGRDPWVLGLR